MKAKFKPGDKVRILDGSKIDSYVGSFTRDMKRYVGGIKTIREVAFRGSSIGYYMEEVGFIWDERGLEKVVTSDDWKVVIIPDGNETLGRLYANNKVVKSVTARKHPDDEYSMEAAIATVTDKLLGKKVEEPKLYNGKVVCVSVKADRADTYTTGRIYTFKNGRTIDDKGCVRPIVQTPIKSFEDLCEKCKCAKFIEVVE